SFWLGQIGPYFSGAAKLYPYILAAKDPITPVIYRRYYYADAKMRAKILRFSGVIESRNLLPLIKQGLDDFNWEVRRQAEWRFNHAFGWLEDKPELAKMLIEKKNLWHFKPNHHGFSFYATKDWYQSFFNLVKAKKAYLHDLGKLKAVKNCPEEVIIANLEFLIKNLTTSYSKSPIFKKGRHGYFKYKDLKVIRSLLLNVKQKKYLRKFSPLLTLLLHDKAYWGARMSLSSSRPIKASYKSILGFSHYRNDKFLKRIVAALSIKDVEAWQKNIAPNFLTDLFLQSLLTEKKGGELNFPRKNYPLKITVIDKSNHEILATSDYVLNYGEETSVVLVSKNKNYSDKKLKLKVLFDREKWMYRVGVNIELKPHGLEVNNSIPVRGLGFDSSIPIAGSYEIFLSEPKETKWIFEHLL
ncbi:MAG: hypothetical protein GQ569_08100, partial [Methylococcaceae bacterium]|nr:hypothetical protein [Methylococcaceae bacterium]